MISVYEGQVVSGQQLRVNSNFRMSSELLLRFRQEENRDDAHGVKG